jgi:threonine/homoserine/homoserine lactone efflux protein
LRKEGKPAVSVASLLLFAAVYFAAVATPGPGVAALVARVLAHGLKGVAPFIAGYVVGDLVWLTIAGTGLAVVAHEFAGLFIALKFAGVAYLLYVAWGMARASSQLEAGLAPARSALGWRAFSGSLSLTLGNPKVIVFFLSIMPLLVDLNAMTPAIFAEIAVTCMIVLTATLAAYALAADRARALLSSRRAVRIAHRAAAGLMAGVAIAIATR